MRASADSTVSTLYIDFDAFFANVEKQLDPALHDKPILICPMVSPRSVVIACCYQAKALGIKRKMTRNEVESLTRDAVWVAARHEVYVDLHHRIIDVINSFAPVVKAWSIDEMECDLGDMPAREALNLAKALRGALAREIGPLVTPSIGLAGNQLLAKIAAEMQKPRGLVLLDPAHMPGAISSVPLRDVPGVAAGMIARLERSGVRSLPDLLALAPKHARAIWGNVEGERMWRALHGERVERPASKRGMFGHSRVLARDWQTPDKAKDCLRLLASKATRRLRAEDFHATKLTVSVKTHAGGRFKVEREFPAVCDDHNLLRILDATFDAMRPKFGRSRLKGVSVFLHGLRKAEDVSGDLFVSRSDNVRLEALSGVMDDLNAKFGGDIVGLGKRVELPGGYAGGKIAFGRIPTRTELGIGQGAASRLFGQ